MGLRHKWTGTIQLSCLLYGLFPPFVIKKIIVEGKFIDKRTRGLAIILMSNLHHTISRHSQGNKYVSVIPQVNKKNIVIVIYQGYLLKNFYNIPQNYEQQFFLICHVLKCWNMYFSGKQAFNIVIYLFWICQSGNQNGSDLGNDIQAIQQLLMKATFPFVQTWIRTCVLTITCPSASRKEHYQICWEPSSTVFSMTMLRTKDEFKFYITWCCITEV